MTAHQTRIRRELLDASDAAIEDAVAFADPMILRGLLYQLTGDAAVAATQIAPSLGRIPGGAGSGDRGRYGALAAQGGGFPEGLSRQRRRRH